MFPRKFIYVFLCLLLPALTLAQQHKDDVLSPDEIDQIRDAAQMPGERFKLYAQFARTRLDALDKSRTNPKIKNHGQEIHDRLQDFLDIYDELDENVDTYADRQDDIRKPLKAVIDADTEFQARLRALQNSATATPQEKNEYQFFLTTAINAVDDGAQDHRQLLAEQEEAAKHRKKHEKEPDDE
jgi:septal ring factor EnvC (AmiA/AmiB activator)